MLFDDKASGNRSGGPPPPDPEQKRSRAWRTYWIVSSGLMILAAVYSGLIFYSRWQENQAWKERAAEKQREDDARTLEMMGGNTFDILSFYASPGHIRRGDTVNLCYGVSNAKLVTLNPKVADVYPAYSNCVRTSPQKTTTYTLTATDAKGQTKSESLTVEVRR